METVGEVVTAKTANTHCRLFVQAGYLNHRAELNVALHGRSYSEGTKFLVDILTPISLILTRTACWPKICMRRSGYKIYAGRASH